MTTPVFRFAPSPNGLLHLGHAYSALVNADMAERLGGRLRLRIEDIDAERSRPEFEHAILADCEWLGLRYEQPVRRQSEHLEAYRAALKQLRAEGLVYPSFMSHRQIAETVAAAERAGVVWPRDPDGSPHYPDFDQQLSRNDVDARIAAGEPFALRIDMAAAIERAGPLHWQEIDAEGNGAMVEADPAAWGDVMLAGRGAVAGYHIAVVVDDAAEGVTHVVRGGDLYAATAIHRLLQTLLELPQPVYHHHRLVLDKGGRKLSKSDGDTGLVELRERGVTPGEIRQMLDLPPNG